MAAYARLEVILIAGLGSLLTAVLAYYFPMWAILPAVLTLALLSFYRDPPRQPPTSADLILAPADGVYTFYCSSDDGARLLIDGKEVLINDGLHEMVEVSGQAALQKGFHTILVEYFDYGAAEGLELGVEIPGKVREVLSKDLLFHETR